MLQIHETDPMSFVNAWEKNSSEYWDWFVNVEMFKSANRFPTINDYIAKICYIILGITALINFERCIPPTYAFYFQHIAIMYPLKLFICSIRK